ncbi:SIMPL domain-containing protein [Roseivivax sp. CAU 1753]
MRRFVTSFAGPLIALSLLAAGPGLAQEDSRARMSVSGTGEAAAVPDMATIRLGVMAQEETATAALDATSEVAGRILERLTAFEIAPRDMQTSGLSLDPVYTRYDRNDGRPPEIVGFRASNQISVRVRDLDRLGDILGAVTGDGANTLDGLSFGVTDETPLLDEARKRAVADARRKAELYAEAAGVTLGQVLSITEQGGGRPYPMPMAEMRMAADSVPVAQGETGYSAQVGMVFEIIP